MPRKWTEEEREAVRERLRLAREKKAALHAQAAAETPKQPEPVAPATTEQDYQALLRHVAELTETVRRLQQQPAPAALPQTPQFGHTGRLVGTLEKHLVDPKAYPDPRTRLASAMPPRIAFEHNYELGWEIQTTTYETKDGLNMKEPRFILELRKIVMDEDSGEPTKGRYVICKMMFHEDPQAALTIAHEKGLEIDEGNQKFFLDEMRFLRMRDWLLEAFFPPKPSQEKKSRKEVVIGGRLVEFFEVNDANPQALPFNELKKKL